MATQAEFVKSHKAILLLLGVTLFLWGPRPVIAHESAAGHAKDIASSAVEAAKVKALAAAYGIRGKTKAIADEVRNKLTAQPNFMTIQGKNDRKLAEGMQRTTSDNAKDIKGKLVSSSSDRKDMATSTKPDFLFVNSVGGGRTAGKYTAPRKAGQARKTIKERIEEATKNNAKAKKPLISVLTTRNDL